MEKTKYRLMVVDDDADIRYVVCALLGSEFETTQAQNGLDALEKVERHQPDLLLLDINMPIMNGLSCCSAIRRNLGAEDLPIIFMSAASSENYRKQAMALGGAAFLEKPFESSGLTSLVRDVLDLRNIVPAKKRFSLEDIEAIDSAPLATEGLEDEPPPRRQPTESSVETVAPEVQGNRTRRIFGKKPEAPAAKPAAPTPAPAPQRDRTAPPPAQQRPSREEVALPAASRSAAPQPPPPQLRPKAPAPKQPAEPSAAEVLARRRLAALGGKVPAPSTGKPRVLVLIDSPDQLEACNTALKGVAEFLPLEDPVEALELIARFQPDIVVASIQTSEYSGLQMAGLLRSNPRLAHTEVIFLRPHHVDPQMVERAAGMTANPIVRSPFTAEEFRAAVERVGHKPGFKLRAKNLSYGVYVKEVIRAADEERLRENRLKERESVEVKMSSLARFMARELAGEQVNFKVRDAPQTIGGKEHNVD